MKLEWQNYKGLNWGPVSAVLGTVGIFFSSQVIGTILLFAVLLLFNGNAADVSDWLRNNNVGKLTVRVFVSALALGMLYMFLRLRNASIRGLGLIKPRLKDISYVLAGIGVYIVLYIVVLTLAKALFPELNLNQEQELGFSTSITGAALILAFVALVVMPPLLEEIMVRGFLFSGLRKKFNFVTAALVSSSLFGLAHLPGGKGGSIIWVAFIDTLVLGMVLAYLRERSGSLWPAIGLHASKNLTAFMFLFVFKIG